MATSRPMSISGCDAQNKPSFLRNASNKASTYHATIPYLRKLPFAAIAIIIALIAVNLLVWTAVGIVLVRHEAEFEKRRLCILNVGSTGTRL
jgi:high-affinity nickel-transport protein